MASETTPTSGTEKATAGAPTSEYPVQRHAGKVGYGPNYNAGASVVEEVEGFVEEVTGKVIHNPKLAHKGHDLHTGESKKKKLLGDDADSSPSPVQTADKGKDKDAKPKHDALKPGSSPKPQPHH